MKLISILFLVFGLLFAQSKVYVQGYYRTDGTYVKGHYRTAPDSNPYNNYSYPGNYNPNKNSTSKKSSSSYLNKSTVDVDGYFKSNGTYVSPHKRTKADSDPFNNYSFPGNYNPNSGKVTKGNKSSYLNNYYKEKKPKKNIYDTNWLND